MDFTHELNTVHINTVLRKMPDDTNTKQRPNRGRGGRGRGRGGRGRGRQQGDKKMPASDTQSQSSTGPCQKILVLHGSRQTGQLLLGRMDKLKKTLQKECNNLQLIAPDGPFDHPEDANLRQWWDRHDSEYRGLETSLRMLQDLWESEGGSLVGILGFSQGARLAHLIALYHQYAKSHNLPNTPFQGLQYVILVAGYDAPIPDKFTEALHACMPEIDASVSYFTQMKLNISSLHIWGARDVLVPPKQSQTVMQSYHNPASHEHDGGHHVPMKAASISAYTSFIQAFTTTSDEDNKASNSKKDTESQPSATKDSDTSAVTQKQQSPPPVMPTTKEIKIPDEETAQAQQDEVEALTAIFPDEVTIVSKVKMNESTGENSYGHPISYRIALHPEDESSASGHWPPRPLSLGVTYPSNYPSDDALPEIKLIHDNNVMQWSSAKVSACLKAVQDAAEAERGMPCILSCVYAAREFLDSGEEVAELVEEKEEATDDNAISKEEQSNQAQNNAPGASLLRQASAERIQLCNLEGLRIAEELLGRAPQTVTNAVTDDAPLLSGKGGSWLYTIGLVGKPR